MKLLNEATSMATSMRVNGSKLTCMEVDFTSVEVDGIKFRGKFHGSKVTSMEVGGSFHGSRWKLPWKQTQKPNSVEDRFSLPTCPSTDNMHIDV